jgi:sulfite reductase (ferredoxin)
MESTADPNIRAQSLSKVEITKTNSRYLRGTLIHEIDNESTSVASESEQIIKHHGAYQQDNRDQRRDGQREYSFLVRTRLPGGKLTASQFLTELQLCDNVGDGTLRITDRQGLQLHGVVKHDLRETMRRINAAKMTTFGACGDVVRNIMCCPAPLFGSCPRSEMQSHVDDLARHFALRSRAYYEIWLTDGDQREHVGGSSNDEEPVYGASYLPRKFKFAFALPDDNCVDALTHDVGFVALPGHNRSRHFNVYVGGGMGVTPARVDTFPAVAQPFAQISGEELLPFAHAVVRVQKEFGNRTDRKRSRFKYLVADWGLERIRHAVSQSYGKALLPPEQIVIGGMQDHLGWHPQAAGRWSLGLHVPSGRIKDDGGGLLKSGLKAIAEKVPMEIRLTPLQDLLLCDIDESRRFEIEQLLRDRGIPFGDEIASVRRLAMACPALPTCGLAITESERAMPAILAELQKIVEELHLENERISIRMTGCPNGCTRPYVAEIAIVGKAVDRYTLFLGGSVAGSRLAFKFRDMLSLDEILKMLRCLLGRFATGRDRDETFGDYCFRIGTAGLANIIHHEDRLDPS